MKIQVAYKKRVVTCLLVIWNFCWFRKKIFAWHTFLTSLLVFPKPSICPYVRYKKLSKYLFDTCKINIELYERFYTDILYHLFVDHRNREKLLL